MGNRLKISFISGLYNCEKYLARCLDSMLCQTYDNFEIILVNNASKDNTHQIAKEYESKHKDKIFLYETDQKLGAGGGRQKGMEFATGDYICIIDCDDHVSPDYLEKLCECAVANHYPDIVMTGFQKVALNGTVKYVRKFKNSKQAVVQSVAPWAKMYKREYLERNKLIFRNMAFGEDVIFSAEVYLTDPTTALENKGCGYFWLENPTSTSHTELRNFPRGVLSGSKEYFQYMRVQYPDRENELCYFMTKYYLWYLLQSGRGVLPSRMVKEYRKMFSFVETVFPDWYNNKYLIKEDKIMIKLAVMGARLLKRLGMLKGFLKLYTRLPMERLWPSL